MSNSPKKIEINQIFFFDTNLYIIKMEPPEQTISSESWSVLPHTELAHYGEMYRGTPVANRPAFLKDHRTKILQCFGIAATSTGNFLGATYDHQLHAADVNTGEVRVEDGTYAVTTLRMPSPTLSNSPYGHAGIACTNPEDPSQCELCYKYQDPLSSQRSNRLFL